MHGLTNLKILGIYLEEPYPFLIDNYLWLCHVLEIVIFAMAQQPLVDQGLVIVDVSRSHSDTPHLVGLLWTSDQPDAETYT